MKPLRDTLPAAVHSASDVREIDRMAVEGCGIPGYELMCRAGKAALDVLHDRWPDAHKLAVYCGAGNNAGDGYVLARLARAAGRSVRVETVVPPERLRGDAAAAWRDCRDAGVTIEPFVPATAAESFTPDVVVDALLGTGLARPVDGLFAEAVEHINSAAGTSAAPVLALDIPSGLHADSGHVLGVAVRASVTITFVGLKQGLFLGDAPDHCGDLEFSDLTLPPDLARSFEPVFERLGVRLLGRALPRRPRSSHKGMNGRVLLIGGGPGMSGAIRLAAEAALRVGAGLVYVGTHRDSLGTVMAGRPELMCRVLDTPEEVDPLLEQADVIVLGPGLGKSDWARGLWARVLDAPKPVVLDADGLNLLAEQPRTRSDWLLTPHPGEAARLLDCGTAAIAGDRLAAARELARRFDSVVVLKGARTLVAGPAARVHVCDRGNPGMATAGMGDVLSGVLGGLLGQLHDVGLAARAGVLLHALAADEAAADGERGMVAADLMPALRRWANPI